MFRENYYTQVVLYFHLKKVQLQILRGIKIQELKNITTKKEDLISENSDFGKTGKIDLHGMCWEPFLAKQNLFKAI